jgi:hypothetical protein
MSDVVGELTPEFFYSPHIFGDDFRLPEWCHNSPFEFVYLHRKALESDSVSSHLSTWIDRVFGCQCSSGFGLFAQPHPPRRLAAHSLSIRTPLSLPSETKSLLFAHFIGSPAPSICFFGVAVDGSVSKFKLDNANRSDVTVANLGTVPVQSLIFGPHREGFIAMQKHGAIAYHVRDRSLTKEELDLGQIEFAAGSDNTVAVANSHGQIFTWELADVRSKKPICDITNDYITCLAVNRNFGMIVVGTVDRHIIVSSSVSRSFLFSRDVGAAPTRLLVTKAWGFILVEAGDSLTLFNVNGALLKKVNYEFVIDQIVTWTGDACVDFCAVADTRGMIHIFEAFYMNLSESVHRVQGMVVAMSYVAHLRALVVITSSGDVTFIAR